MLKCSNNSMVKLIDKDYINLTEKYKQYNRKYSKKYNKIKFFDFRRKNKRHKINKKIYDKYCDYY